MVYATMGGRTEANAIDMAQALRLGTLGVKHSDKTVRKTAPNRNDAERVLPHIQKSGSDGLTRREIYQACRLTKRAMDLALETLADGGFIVEDRRQRWPRYVDTKTQHGQELLSLQPTAHVRTGGYLGRQDSQWPLGRPQRPDEDDPRGPGPDTSDDDTDDEDKRN